MARMTLSVDTSDCSAVISAVAKFAEGLKWPHRERFRDEVEAMIEDGSALEMTSSKQAGVIEARASAALLDLMRKYGHASGWPGQSKEGT